MRFLFFLLLLLLPACTTIIPTSEVLTGENYLVDLDDDQIYALKPDDDMLAYVNNGLHLLRISDRFSQQLTYDSPRAISWSPSGRTLVAALPDEEQTRLVAITSNPDERPQVLVDEEITDFAWLGEDDLMALGYILDAGEERATLVVNLIRWDGQWHVERTQLYTREFERRDFDTSLPLVLQFDLSGLKDAIIYNRYLTAPGTDGLQELVLYNLLSQKEKVLRQVGADQSAAYFSADSESLLLPSMTGVTQRYNPWQDKVLEEWLSAGTNIQVAEGRDLHFIDGSVFSKDIPLMSLPADAKVSFANSAETLLAAWQRKLYLVKGLTPPEKKELSSMQTLRLHQLRLRRSLGEIDQRQFEYFQNKALNP